VINDRWKQVRAVLEDALDQPASERAQFIAQACAGDAELQAEVEEYLRCEELADYALPVSEWIRDDPHDIEEVPDPERVGAYRILRRIGEGGMGVVYLAERDDGEYKQHVALKIIKPGPQRMRLLQQFRQERQILAQLQHPHIAHLIDGGTAAGQIYFVMEYVEGAPITAYCRDNNLSTRNRLALFCRACEAVSHAHRNLIIHRDLKPGNILVTSDSVPKLLDFGLAKVFHDGAASKHPSMTITPMLTPAYASPEQVRGEPLSTATDIYSLGVLLYELLTGRNPHHPEEKSPIEVCRIVCEEDAAPPSRSADPGTRRALVGDLDNIVLMALRKEPERRYRSVEDLRRDIQRYLDGFPVLASRSTMYYRCRKYVRRHLWGVAASVLGLIAALAAATMIWWEGRLAEMRFNDVRELAHSVIFELYDSVQNLPGSTAAQKLLVDRAIQYLRKLEAAGRPNDVELQLDLAAAYVKIARVQGHVRYSNLGDTAGSEDSFARARGIALALLRRHPDLEQAEDLLSEADQGLGGIRWLRGDAKARFELGRERTDILLRKAQRHPEDPRLLAVAQFSMAQDLFMAGQWAASVPAWKRAISSWERSAAKDPKDGVRLALCRNQLGFVYRTLHDLPHALAEYSAGERISSHLVESYPLDISMRQQLCLSLEGIGGIHWESGNWQGALEQYRRSLAIRRGIAASDANDMAAKLDLAKLLSAIAPLEERAGDRERAIRFAADASAAFESALKIDAKQREALMDYRNALSQWSALLMHRAEDRTRTAAQAAADWAGAAQACERALAASSQLVQDGSMPDDNNAARAEIMDQLSECRKHLKAAMTAAK
jgi:tetratricopeptide (TPR) repeat protein